MFVYFLREEKKKKKSNDKTFIRRGSERCIELSRARVAAAAVQERIVKVTP